MSDQFKCEFAKRRKAEMLAQGAFETEDFGFACECAAPSVPGDDFDLICNAIDKADTITMEGDYMLDSDDCIAVVRVMQVLLSVRAAMLAAK